MSTLITINVTNNSPQLQNFFFFQNPAVYAGGAQVYTNSLFTAPLLPYPTSGAVLSFWTNLQFYAGAQQQVSPPQVGQSSGQLSAIQAIGLTSASGGTATNNTTTMSVAPSLGLSAPVSTTGPQPGSFRIITPTFNPNVQKFNIGSALKTQTGQVTLSNFVQASPNQNTDCQPVLKFYVAVGTYTPGTVMNFTQSSIGSALCDATQGNTTFQVTYNADGTWTVNTYALVVNDEGTRALLPSSAAINAEVYNEAGTAVIARGFAANFALPITIQNLDNPGAIRATGEYQIAAPIGSPRRGVMCTTIAGNVATFA